MRSRTVVRKHGAILNPCSANTTIIIKLRLRSQSHFTQTISQPITFSVIKEQQYFKLRYIMSNATKLPYYIPPVSTTFRSFVLPSYPNTALKRERMSPNCLIRMKIWMKNPPVDVRAIIEDLLPCFSQRVTVLLQIDRHFASVT